MGVSRDTVALFIISKKLDPSNHIEFEDGKFVEGLELMMFSLLGRTILSDLMVLQSMALCYLWQLAVCSMLSK